MRQIDVFEKDIDKFFEEGNVTKAQLFVAFHKANPNSLDEIEQLQLGVVSNSKPNINYKDIDFNLRELLMQTGERLYFDGKDITDEFLNSDSDLFTIM